MNTYHDPKEAERVAHARESFSGRLLTDRQFDEAIVITGIIENEIKRSGAFKDKLGDYAYAFARSEKFDAMKSETVLRDLFRERTGMTMNQMREEQAKREEAITEQQRDRAYTQACGIGDLIENGVKMSFNRAYAHQAQQLAQEFGVSDACAKRLMKEEFAAAEGGEGDGANDALYTWGKELEERFYRPQIEAEKADRKAQRQMDGQSDGQTESRTRTATRTRSPHRTRTGPQ